MEQYKSQRETVNAIQQKELTTAWKRDGFMKKIMADHRQNLRKSELRLARGLHYFYASLSLSLSERVCVPCSFLVCLLFYSRTKFFAADVLVL